MYVNTNSNDKNSEYAKEENAMNKNCNSTCRHVSELHHSRPRRQLEQKTRRQQDKEYRRNDYRTPISRRHIDRSSGFLQITSILREE
ncbi:hypothetical protein MA16_Dca029031 [Dendrobium catenatum]|uniref:Uncharacterized protein n=1 Tax=Dendrobium catenatum TaxID=906689 RepID=A0A2I0VD93_9ASPA|nr:hypothetical protein MA16_Dca029031 [Dendrobium catenatum]